MGDLGVRIGRAQLIQETLVGHLAGQAHIPRLERLRRAAHQRAAPVRGSAGNMRHARGPGAGQKLRGRLARARQHQRRAAEHGTQVDLQAAVAADVIERAPHHARCGRLARQRAGQAREGVGDELRGAGRARGEKYPLGGERRLPIDLAGHGRGIQVRELHACPGDRGDLGERLGAELRRGEHQPARDAIELEQRDGGAQLLAHGEKHRAPAQRFEPSAEAGGVRKTRQLHGHTRGMKCASAARSSRRH